MSDVLLLEILFTPLNKVSNAVVNQCFETDVNGVLSLFVDISSSNRYFFLTGNMISN